MTHLCWCEQQVWEAQKREQNVNYNNARKLEEISYC